MINRDLTSPKHCVLLPPCITFINVYCVPKKESVHQTFGSNFVKS